MRQALTTHFALVEEQQEQQQQEAAAVVAAEVILEAEVAEAAVARIAGHLLAVARSEVVETKIVADMTVVMTMLIGGEVVGKASVGVNGRRRAEAIGAHRALGPQDGRHLAAGIRAAPSIRNRRWPRARLLEQRRRLRD